MEHGENHIMIIDEDGNEELCEILFTFESEEFGKAYQCIMPTDNENELVKFVMESQDTSGGDGDEFYELVIKKIVEDTPWRENSTRVILLISDATPHPVGYTYEDIVVNNRIDWKEEAKKAASMKIKIDTVTITNEPWYRELSEMTNGMSVPFESGYKTGRLLEAAAFSRGSVEARKKFDKMSEECDDEEMKQDRLRIIEHLDKRCEELLVELSKNG